MFILLKTPPPIPYREILLTARIMEEIFSQVHPANLPRTDLPNIVARVEEESERGAPLGILQGAAPAASGCR
jgi:hypothetical protein